VGSLKSWPLNGPLVDSKPRVLYLIGQFPAINHGYLLAEILHLRRLGFEIYVVSVSPPDRPIAELTEAEREEVERTFCVKSLSTARITILNALEFFRNPSRYLRGVIFTLELAGLAPKRIFYHLAYFAEAVIVGRWMRELSINHLHASFSATVALIASRIFPVTWSFGVYGFGELHDPVATHLKERIQSALFVRSISKHGRGQLERKARRTVHPHTCFALAGFHKRRATHCCWKRSRRSCPKRTVCACTSSETDRTADGLRITPTTLAFPPMSSSKAGWTAGISRHFILRPTFSSFPVWPRAFRWF